MSSIQASNVNRWSSFEITWKSPCQEFKSSRNLLSGVASAAAAVFSDLSNIAKYVANGFIHVANKAYSLISRAPSAQKPEASQDVKVVVESKVEEPILLEAALADYEEIFGELPEPQLNASQWNKAVVASAGAAAAVVIGAVAYNYFGGEYSGEGFGVGQTLSDAFLNGFAAVQDGYCNWVGVGCNYEGTGA